MKATITSTDRIVEIDAEVANPMQRLARPGAPIFTRVKARVWEGTTENGIPFVAYIPLVQCSTSHDQAEFEALKEHKAPSAETSKAIDMRFFVD